VSLTDNEFTLFIKSLQGERRADAALKRGANSVIAIGRVCLDFLACVGRFHGENDFVGQKGQIRGHRRSFVVGNSRSTNKGVVKTYWHHRAFPTPDTREKRLPISNTNIKKLRDAILDASSSIYLRKRRYTMMTLLEITGARRSEVADLTVQSVHEAAQMKEPQLKFETGKRGGNRTKTRLVPVSRIDVDSLLEFIEKNRRTVIRRTCGIENDGGYLLVNERTGKRLNANTITQEVAMLRNSAGIDEKACAHMFRHRRVTKLFRALIEQHNLENVDDFRRALLDVESIKREVQQWTGHTNVASLDVYIHLAFDEITNFRKTIDGVMAVNAIESARRQIEQIREEMKAELSPYEASRQLTALINAISDDLKALTDTTPERL